MVSLFKFANMERGDEMFTQKRFCMSSEKRFIATNRGFTLVELMIVLAIVAINVSLAVPSFTDTLQRRETTAQAEELVAFVSSAKSESVKFNEMVSVHLTYTDRDNWCIGANEGSAPCDCTETDTGAANFCSLNDLAKIVRSSAQTKSSMTTASTDRTFVFDPIRGTMATADLGTNHGLTLESDNSHWSLQVDIGATGRVRICNPDDTKAVPGYQSCPSVGVSRTR
jgi:type IV fimbrial biogenesis protein FimT